MADVLKAAGKGTRKTRTMHTANLGYVLLRKCLDEAVTVGYLKLSRQGRGVTEEGSVFMKKYSEYSNRCSKVGRELESMKLEREELAGMRTDDGTSDFKPVVGVDLRVQSARLGP
jgi:predicted transcriptional regulator